MKTTAHNCCVVHVLQDVVAAVLGVTVMGHQGEQQGGQNTSLEGVSAQEMTLDVLLPTRTDWVLSVKKSSNQLHRDVFEARGSNLHTRFWGMIMLNAELKSRNSIRTWMFFFSNCSRLRWRSVEMASSVERFDWYAYWCRSNCNWVKVVKAGDGWFLGNWNYCG